MTVEPIDQRLLDLDVPVSLARPGAIADRQVGVLDHKIDVNRGWWERHLADAGLGDELFDAPDGGLTRGDLFGLGAAAADGPVPARRLLWATLAWGTGTRHRNNARRIAAVAADPDATGDLLAGAAEASRRDPAEAFMALRPRANAIPYLGPPFFTKFLYFSGGGAPAHGCLILDSVIAGRLRGAGWDALRGRYAWSAEEYAAYCRLMMRWADEVSVGGRVVAADQLERTLFDG